MITQDAITNDYVIPKDYVKPDITVGNYYLKWEDASYGIPQKEIPELKRFITEIAPYLTSILHEAANEIHRIAEEKIGSKESHRLDEVFSPEILVRRRRDQFTYALQMKRDGTTIISRTERIIISQKGKVRAMPSMQWNLGELLFNRQKLHTKL
jgi:hypothetical protein